MKKNLIIVGSRGYQFKYGGWETFVTNFVDYSTGRVKFTLSYEATANMKISFELNRVNICKYNENALNSVVISPEYLK